jgi:uncharacterized membrane protein HdeD (DUF308 family)
MSSVSASTAQSTRNYWWVFLLQGLAAIGFGIFLLMQPAVTLVILTTFMGAYWLVDGVFKVIGAFTGQRGDRSWWLLLLSGLLGILGGIVVLSQPLLATLITQVFAVYMLAAQALVGGILTVIWAIRVRDEIKGEGWIILDGVLAIILGILLFSAPLMSIWILAMITAILAIVGGIALIVIAFRWRKVPT